jgi:hypothetical protein
MVCAEQFDVLSQVNKCQIAALEKAAISLSPSDCAQFFKCVRNVQSAIIHTYQYTAFIAIREPEPDKAALHWKAMVDICDNALNVLKDLRGSYQNCGTSDLYDLALDYRAQAHDRYLENLQDSECKTTPEGLVSAEELNQLRRTVPPF